VELARIANMVPGFKAVALGICWIFALLGVALSLVIPVAFLMHGDALGLLLFLPATAFSLYEILRGARRKKGHFVGRILWPILIGALPYLGALLYRATHWNPESWASSAPGETYYY
tara:strand:- start:77078 stop:77425 length:348 start_codon:yes stop_codon:yes gene_type:complete